MPRITDEMKCLECGKFLINTAGGNYSTCPEMHGKLHVKLSPYEMALIACSQLPVATKHKDHGIYVINGKCHMREATLTMGAAAKRFKEGKIVAVCDSLVERFGEFVETGSDSEGFVR